MNRMVLCFTTFAAAATISGPYDISFAALKFSLAKIENAFKVSSIQGGYVTCYMDEAHWLAQFPRTTRDRWSFWQGHLALSRW